jgi:hypothetical protein
MNRRHQIQSTGGSFRGLRRSGGQPEPTNGRQGKRPAFGAAHVVGWIREFADVTDTPCWRFRRFLQRIQGSKRHRPAESPDFPP